MIRVPHLFFFGIGRILSMKLFTLFSSCGSLGFCARIFFVSKEKKKKKEDEGFNEKNTREK